jgi:hypothetical protein
LPLATCFDYAAKPQSYNPEASWRAAVKNRFGVAALPHWRALREFCDLQQRAKHAERPLRPSAAQRRRWRAALAYLGSEGDCKWAREITPWSKRMQTTLE